MTKKNLKPKQAAPVQRENTATVARQDPFAGDDAE